MSEEKYSETTERVWRNWKTACAADLCEPEAAEALRRFGALRWAAFYRRYAVAVRSTEKPTSTMDARSAWHLLESHSLVGKNRAGKRYKDWLFARAEGGDSWLAAVEAGATLLMRDAVREHLRREHAPAFMTSLQRPLAGDASLTLEQLLPDACDLRETVDQHTWDDLARRIAPAFLTTLERNDRVVLWAKSCSYTLYDARILAWTNQSAATLYNKYRECMERLAKEVASACPGEAAAVLVQITLRALTEVTDLIDQKIKLEKGAARFFR